MKMERQTSHPFQELDSLWHATQGRWIMKYYILDLSARNSLVKYLVGQGHTVFIVSWVNPGFHERDLCLEDYLEFGIMGAVEKVSEVTPNRKIHATTPLLRRALGGRAGSGGSWQGREREYLPPPLGLFQGWGALYGFGALHLWYVVRAYQARAE